MSKKHSLGGKSTILKDAHDPRSAAIRHTVVQNGLDGGERYYAETGLIALTSTDSSDVLYILNDNTTEDIVIEDLSVDIYNADGDAAHITVVKNPTGFSGDKSLALANSMKTVLNAHFNDTGLQSAAITLANSLKTNLNNHYGDYGALTSSITLANSLKTTLNAHYTDYGALSEAQTLCNSLKTKINNHFSDSGALSSSNTLANSLKTNINAHFSDSGAQSSAITLANSLKTVINAHYNDYDALTTAISLANDLQSKLNNHYGLANVISAANLMKTALNAHYANVTEHTGAFAAISAANATDHATLLTLIGAMLTSFGTHEDDDAGAGTYHQAVETGSYDLTSEVAPTTLNEAATRLNDLITKYNQHQTDFSAHTNGNENPMSPGESEVSHKTWSAADTTTAASNLATLKTLTDALITSYDAHDADAEGGAPTIHDAQEGSNHSLTSTAAASDLDAAISRLNDLKTKLNTHDADATAHPEEDSQNQVSTADATGEHLTQNANISAAASSNLATLITLITAELTSYDTHDNDAEQATPTIHILQEGGDASLTSASAPTTLDECVTRVNDLKAKFNTHDADTTGHLTGSQHQESTANAAGEHLTIQTTISTANASDLATLLTLITSLMAAYVTHDDDSILATPTYHILQGTEYALTSEVAPTTLSESIVRVNDLKSKYNSHDADSTAHLTGSQNQESNSDAAGEHLASQATISAANATNQATLETLLSALLTGYDTHDNDAEQATPTTHILQESGDASLTSSAAPTTLDECVTRINDLKAKYNTHDADATAHLDGSVYQESNSDSAGEHLTTQANVSAANATNQATLITLVSALLAAYVIHDDDAALATPVYHVLQDTAHALTSEVAPTTYIESVTRLNDLKAKYNLHDAETSAHQTGGDHQESTANGVGTEVTTHNLNFSSSNTSGVSIVSGDEADNLSGGTDIFTEYDAVEGSTFTVPFDIQLGASDSLGIQVDPDAITTNYTIKISINFHKLPNEA